MAVVTDICPLKAVVLDLDNVVWDGYCHEGPEKLRLRQDIFALMHFLDARGILLAAVSKNVFSDATDALKHFDLSALFVGCEIGWGPKSAAIRRIGSALGIHTDSFAFIDDEPSERAEVHAAFPGILVMSPDEVSVLYVSERIPKVITPESSRRRQFYKVEARRHEELTEEFKGDYERFLESCRIQLFVSPASPESLSRIVELFARTSRLNFSGQHYSDRELLDALREKKVQALAIRVTDRFGDYGLCGAALIDVITENSSLIVRDLVLSCRVQGRFVEHSLLAWFASFAKEQGKSRVKVHFLRTDANAHLEAVFHALGWARTEGGEDGYVSGLSSPSLPPRLLHPVEWQPQGSSAQGEGLPFVRSLVLETLKTMPEGSKVLDLGGGYSDVMGDSWPADFRRYYPTAWLTRVDERALAGVDLVANAEDMQSVPDGSLEVVLLLEVLEHTERFWMVRDEVYRILRFDGIVVVSAPFRSPVHREPRDFYRFTPDGLRNLFSRFQIVRFEIEGAVDDPIRTVLVGRKIQEIAL